MGCPDSSGDGWTDGWRGREGGERGVEEYSKQTSDYRENKDKIKIRCHHYTQIDVSLPPLPSSLSPSSLPFIHLSLEAFSLILLILCSSLASAPLSAHCF